MPIPTWLKHLSFNSLKTYENCPRCFFLKYSLKIWEEEVSPGMLFGKELHDRVAEYHKWTKPDWKKKIDKKCPEEIKEEVKPYLDMYKKMYTPEAEHVEKEFLVNFLHPDTKRSLGIPLKGFMDLIKDGYVIDHKTSSGRYTKRQAHDLKQLTLYSYAYRQLFGEREKGLRLNVFLKRKTPGLRSLEIVETARDNADYADFWAWAKPLVERIMAGRFGRKNASQDWWFKHLDVCI